jgi:hypothetical protein
LGGQTGEDLGLIFFLSGGGEGRLSRSAAVEIPLDVSLADGQTRRDPIYDHP